MSATATIPGMGRKKTGNTSGPHKTPRTSVQVPNDWLKVARQRASTKQQPVLWYLLSLIQKDAAEAGVADLPPLPWEDADDE